MNPSPISDNRTVFIVDDDLGVRDALSLLLAMHGMRVQVFARAEDFLAAITPHSHGCALVDVRMQGMGGLELQNVLKHMGIHLPVIVMTGFGNVAAARLAFKSGAVDFLAKPISEPELFEALQQALSRQMPEAADTAAPATAASELVCQLTAREREVLHLLGEGLTSRDVGKRLNITHRTVETYKGRMMEKLKVRKLSELIRVAATGAIRSGSS